VFGHRRFCMAHNSLQLRPIVFHSKSSNMTLSGLYCLRVVQLAPRTISSFFRPRLRFFGARASEFRPYADFLSSVPIRSLAHSRMRAVSGSPVPWREQPRRRESLPLLNHDPRSARDNLPAISAARFAGHRPPSLALVAALPYQVLERKCASSF
jgi:hypothetical protein